MKHLYFLLLTLTLSLATDVAIGQASNKEEVRSHLRAKKVEVKLYPNPASDRFSISVPSADIKYITIHNIIGKKIRKVAVDPNNSYNIEDLQRGIYIVRIFDQGDNLMKAIRLSKT